LFKLIIGFFFHTGECKRRTMSSASKQKRKKYVDLHVIVTIMSSIIVPVCLCSTLLDCLHVFLVFFWLR